MNIAAIAAAGVNKAWATVASELIACTLRDAPTTTHDTATDTSSATWGAEQALDAFLWDDKKKENEPPKDDTVEARNRKAMIRRSDCPAFTEITTAAVLEETVSGIVWEVTAADSPPGGAIFILTLRR